MSCQNHCVETFQIRTSGYIFKHVCVGFIISSSLTTSCSMGRGGFWLRFTLQEIHVQDTL